MRLPVVMGWVKVKQRIFRLDDEATYILVMNPYPVPMPIPILTCPSLNTIALLVDNTADEVPATDRALHGSGSPDGGETTQWKERKTDAVII